MNTNKHELLEFYGRRYGEAFEIGSTLKLLESTARRYALNIFSGQDIAKILSATSSLKERIKGRKAPYSELCYDVHYNMALQLRRMGMECEIAYGDVLYRGKSLFSVDPKQMIDELKGGVGELKGHCWLLFDGVDAVDLTIADWMATNWERNLFTGYENNAASIVSTEVSDEAIYTIIDTLGEKSKNNSHKRSELAMGDLVYNPVLIGSKAYELFSGGRIGTLESQY